MLTDLQIHIGRTEDRIATTDAGALYTYGKGESSFNCTLLATTPELDSLNTLTQIDSDGDMTATAWKIVAADLASGTKTFAATGVLKEIDIRKAPEGKVEIDLFVRITGDTVSVSQVIS